MTDPKNLQQLYRRWRSNMITETTTTTTDASAEDLLDESGIPRPLPTLPLSLTSPLTRLTLPMPPLSLSIP